MDINKNELPGAESSLGVADGKLGNAQFSASSYMDSAHAWQGRLGNSAKGNAKVGAWCSKELNKNQYLEIDLGEVQKVGAIATQGRPDFEEDGGWFVQSYTVAHSTDGENWNNYKEFGIPKVFEGNRDHSSTAVNHFKMGVNARYIRFKPVTWNGHIAMRVELYRESKTKMAVSKSKGSNRNIMDQKRQSGTANARGNPTSQRVIANGFVNVQVKTRPKQTEKEVNGIEVSQAPDVSVRQEDKTSQERESPQPLTNSHTNNVPREESAAVTTGDQNTTSEQTRRVERVDHHGEITVKSLSKGIKSASAAVTSAQGEKYIGRIKLIKKEERVEPEEPEEAKPEKKEIDCDITPVVKKRIKDMSSRSMEIQESQRRSVLLDEEIRYTEDMEANVNQRVEMFREAERLKKEREEAERKELEKKKQDRLRRTEELKRKMQDSSDGSPAHSDSGKSDGFDGSVKVELVNPAQRAVASHVNGALGESWENLSIEGQEDGRQNLEFEQKLEGIGNEHDGYDPERERSMLDQTEDAFRNFVTQGKQSPTGKPQSGKTSMLIKSFSVMHDPSEIPAPLRRQLSEPKTPVKAIEDETVVSVDVAEAESSPQDELVFSSASSGHEDTQEIEVGFVRRASERYKQATETRQEPQTSPLIEEELHAVRELGQEEAPTTMDYVNEAIEELVVETMPESIPPEDEMPQASVGDATERDAVETPTPPMASANTTESDVKDIESGIVRKFKERFVEQQVAQQTSSIPQKMKTKPLLSVSKGIDVKERSASSGSEASEAYVSESMSIEFLLKEIAETQVRIQGGERHVTIAKERLEQCQSSTDSSEAIEAEEEFHEASLELSRLRKKLLRLQKQAKESGENVEIDFKGLDRSGATLYAPSLKVDREGPKVSRECKAPQAKEAPPVDTSVYNDEGECVPEGNVLSQIKAFEKLKAQ